MKYQNLEAPTLESAFHNMHAQDCDLMDLASNVPGNRTDTFVCTCHTAWFEPQTGRLNLPPGWVN